MAARQSPVLLQMAELLKGSADQEKEFSVHGRKANQFATKISPFIAYFSGISLIGHHVISLVM